DLIQADGGQDLLGFGTAADGVWQTGRFHSPQLMAKLAGQHSAPWRGLGVAILQVVILDHLLVKPQAAKIRYGHLLQAVVEATAKKECQLAVLVPPATMKHVEQIAGSLEKMPPKSTYFYPKLLSGLVFNPLTGS